jgi:hypothetical protein
VHERIVKGPSITVEDDALPVGGPDCQLGTKLERPLAARYLGEVDSGELERHDLTEPPLVAAFEHDIATDLELQSVQ